MDSGTPAVDLWQRCRGVHRRPARSNGIDGEEIAVRIGEPRDSRAPDRRHPVRGLEMRKVVIDGRDAAGSQVSDDAIQVVDQEGRERRAAYAGGFALIDGQRAFSSAEPGFSRGAWLAYQFNEAQAKDAAVELQCIAEIRYRHDRLDPRSCKHLSDRTPACQTAQAHRASERRQGGRTLAMDDTEQSAQQPDDPRRACALQQQRHCRTRRSSSHTTLRGRGAIRDNDHLRQRVSEIERSKRESGSTTDADRLHHAVTISGHPGEVWPETLAALRDLVERRPPGLDEEAAAACADYLACWQ